jgi:hypothetical protein
VTTTHAPLTPAEMLETEFAIRKLKRKLCPLCQAYLPNPLASQAAFQHHFDPQTYHRCRNTPR